MALTDPALDMSPSLTVDLGHAASRIGQDNSRLQAIAEALPDAKYDRALAMGATHGVGRKLSRRCAFLEVVRGAWRGRAGDELDLVIVCDSLVGMDDLDRHTLLEQLMATLRSGGHLVLAHWLDEAGADDAAAAFITLAEERLLPVSRRRTPHYRVDVLERA
jgi:hypothetical protein